MKFYGELLVFVLLFITNLRVFFVHHVRRDPLVVLAPFTFIVAIFQILAWGIDVFTVLEASSFPIAGAESMQEGIFARVPV